jgi:hypothetical protein
MKNLIYSPDAETINMVPNHVFSTAVTCQLKRRTGLTERKKGEGHMDKGHVVSKEGRGDSGDIQLGHQSNNFAC